MCNDAEGDRPGRDGHERFVTGQIAVAGHHNKDDAREASWSKPSNKTLGVQAKVRSQQANHDGQHSERGQAEYGVKKDGR